jgi:hypothetical protein
VIEEEGLVSRAAAAGEELAGRLRGFVEKYERVVDVRGRGLMLGIVLDRPAKELCKTAADTGLLTLATAENVVRLLPPLNVKDAEIEEALEILDDCLAEWHGAGDDAEAGEAEVAGPPPEEEDAGPDADAGELAAEGEVATAPDEGTVPGGGEQDDDR